MSRFEDPEICRTVLESMQNGIYLADRSEKSRFWNEAKTDCASLSAASRRAARWQAGDYRAYVSA